MHNQKFKDGVGGEGGLIFSFAFTNDREIPKTNCFKPDGESNYKKNLSIVRTRAANSNLNSKELHHFAELELELAKKFFFELELA